jgi:hypothetical protein
MRKASRSPRALEVWVILWALGIRANYAEAYALERVSQGIRSVMFLVPGALGFQEGGFLMVGRALTLSGGDPKGFETHLAADLRRWLLTAPAGITSWTISISFLLISDVVCFVSGAAASGRMATRSPGLAINFVIA